MINAKGIRAFNNLLHVAHAGTGQSRTASMFLMSLINGHHYQLNLTELRGLELRLFEDCINMLRTDYFTCTGGSQP